MNVMKRAWEIAKAGQRKFGGKVKEYFAESLRLAWKEAKAAKEITVEDVETYINSVMKSDSYSVNYWAKYGKERLYVNYYTGSGYRKEQGFLELQNGVIVAQERGAYTPVTKAFWRFKNAKINA
ncbi:hypothetical protein ABET14_04860 [Heyndrickxia coagulans]|uniref:hypothetical protein n=1 Tax=Heyndrickxia coagulans TaxID=1398 RepID=UPI003D1B2729